MPAPEWQRIGPLMQAVDLPLGLVLCESGGKMAHGYFPINAIVALLDVMEDGSSAEIAADGRPESVGGPASR